MRLAKTHLAAIAAREQSASAGPWELDGRCVSMSDDTLRPGEAIVFLPSGPDVPDDDLAFVAHARQDVPDLLADLLEAQNALRRILDSPSEAQAIAAEALREPDGAAPNPNLIGCVVA